MYGAECLYGSRLVTNQLPRNGRILEVGAGLGMLSAYLRKLGYDITALEPCTGGFDFFGEIRKLVSQEIETDIPVLGIRAEELSPERHGSFQFIFSVNVLEHIPDLAGAMRAMTSVLGERGRMWHTCPNYVVPYEPHFGLPLIPLFPRATQVLMPKKIVGSELWLSLNFITYYRLKRLASVNGLTATFRSGTMAEAFARFDSDPEFAGRQKGIAFTIYRVLKAVGALAAVRTLPPALSTPMMVDLEKPVSP
ncbi:MAG TPA: class I SAM-dependent methyltransferase [Bryobacteraceae bacterium]|nr:class I SAM-dependent methyltransferase [Bryobacteraceae bacterium]